MLGKKESIWLGIRIIGLIWLLRFLYTIIQFVWVAGYWLFSKINAAEPGNLTITWITYLSTVPVPLVLTIYFLFFGTLIYKLIYHFVRTNPEDPSCPAGYSYCEIITRFLGVWVAVLAISTLLYTMLLIPIQQVIQYYYISQTRGAESNAFAEVWGRYFDVSMLIYPVIYLALAFLAGWYFFKKGKFFINLLHRLWLKKAGA